MYLLGSAESWLKTSPGHCFSPKLQKNDISCYALPGYFLGTVTVTIPFSRIGLHSSWALWITPTHALHAHNSGCAPTSRRYLCFDLRRSRAASGHRAQGEISRDTRSTPP